MFISLGVDSAFGYVDYFMEFFLDTFPWILKHMRKEIVCIFVVTTCFLCGWIFCLGSGYYTFGMFDSYSCGMNLYFCLVAECILIAWVFGIDKLDVLLQKECQEAIPQFVKFCVKFFIPIFTTINIILYFIVEFSADTAKGRNWPTGLTWLGRMMWVIPILTAFIGLAGPKF
jgi:SNF family Na+-dependent transporter